MQRSFTHIALLLILSIGVPKNCFSQEIRINCGGPAYSYDTWGWFFESDRPYSVEAGSGYLSGENREWIWVQTQNTLVRNVYATVRENSPDYRFDLPPGDYILEFYYSEMEAHWPGQNRIRFIRGSEPLCPFFDPWIQAGREYALVFRFLVHHDGGALFTGVDSEFFAPKLAGIGVIPADTSDNFAITPGSFFAEGGHHEIVLSWHWYIREGIRGFIVERSFDGGAWIALPDTYFVSFARIPTSPGVTASFRVRSVDVHGNISLPTAPLEATAIGWESPLPVYHLSMPPAQVESLFSDIYSDQYRGGSLRFGDDSLALDVGVRFRGASNRPRQKKSYKIKLRGPEWNGRRKFNLVAEWADASLLHDCASYCLADDLDVEAPTHNFVLMELNGVNMGVFLDMEQLDERYLAAHNFDGDDVIYKAVTCALFEQWPIEYIEAFWERETGDQSDFAPILDLIDAINDAPDSLFYCTVDSALDCGSFLRWWVAEILFSNGDFFGGNYYIRRSSGKGKWHFLPWDNDQGFTIVERTILCGVMDDSGELLARHNVLMRRWLEQPELRRRFLFALGEGVESELESGRAETIIDSLFALIESEALIDCDKKYRARNDVFLSNYGKMIDYIEPRAAYIRADIAAEWENISDLQIVEVCPAGGAIADSSGEMDPWCEILNMTGDAVDLEDFSMTDNPHFPGKWELPKIALQDSGRILLWMDGEFFQGARHSPFRINSPNLYLFSHEGLCIDAFTIACDLPVGFSAERSPEMSENIVPTDSPTPGQPNDDPHILPAEIELFAYPNPFNSAVTIRVRGVEDSRGRVEIFDINGRRVEPVIELVEMPSGTKLPSTGSGSDFCEFVWTPGESLPSGVYLVRAKMENGQTATTRIVLLK